MNFLTSQVINNQLDGTAVYKTGCIKMFQLLINIKFLVAEKKYSFIKFKKILTPRFFFLILRSFSKKISLF